MTEGKENIPVRNIPQSNNALREFKVISQLLGPNIRLLKEAPWQGSRSI